jgi:beta-barrel assembly-enhancing protease
MSMPSDNDTSLLTFQGSLSNGKTAGEPAAAQVQILSTGVEINVAGEREPRLWAFAGLHSSLPLHSNAPDVLLSHNRDDAATLFVADPRFARVLLQHASSLSATTWRLRALAPGLGLLAVAAAVAGIMWTLGFDPAKTVARLMPQKTREALGRSVIASLTNDRKTCETPASRMALDHLTTRLTAAASSNPITVHVVLLDWGLVNAFAVPGGQIIVTKGLLQTATSPDEVAGVLSHELGHALELHPEASLVRGLGLATGAQLVFVGASGTLSNLGLILTQLRYTRIAEREADVHALRILKAAGISAKGLGDFFERIDGKKPSQPSSSKRFTDFSLIRTHPLTADRIAMVRAQTSYPSTPALTEGDWKALRDACGPATAAQNSSASRPAATSAPAPRPGTGATTGRTGPASGPAGIESAGPATRTPARTASAQVPSPRPDLAEADRDIAEAGKALEVNGNDVVALQRRARAYARKGQHDHALADYIKATALKPNDAGLHFGRGVAHQNLRQFEDAVHAYDEAIQLSPNLVGALNNRGNCNRLLKRYESALVDFDELLRVNPKYVAGYYNRALVYAELNRMEEALRDWTTAISEDKDYAGAYVQRGMVYEKAGNRDKAIEDFRAALVAPPKFDSGPWAHRTAREHLATMGVALP